mgnify:CR=1 FL=1
MAKTKVHGEYLDPSVISGQTQVTAVGADSVLIFDATDNALKKALLSDVIETVGSTPSFTSATISGDLTVDTTTLKVDSSNNRVGIGTASPADLLHLVTSSGNSRIRASNGTATAFSGIDSANTMLIGTSSSHDVRLMSNDSVELIIKSGGNVGIGTTTDPTQKLEVYNSATDGQAYVKIQNNRARNAAVNFVTTAANWYVGAGIGTDTDVFQIYDGDVGTRLQIDSSGDIAIAGNLSLTGGGTIEAPSSSGSENLLLNAAGGIHLRIDSNGNSGDDQVFKVMKHTSTAVFTVAETGTATVSGALVVGDTITHGNGVLDLYDGGSNTSLTNGVTNGNVKLQAVVSGVGIAAVIRAGDSALGQVDLPYQSGFQATAPAVTNGGGNVIIFGSTHHNTGSDYDTSNGKYTAPRSGQYLLNASVLIDPGSTTSYERILFGVNENAASTQYGDTLCIPGNTSYEGLNLSCIIYLGAGDYVRVYNMGNSATYGTAYGAFSGFYLG